MIKPILFNTEMVRAILDGEKTVTRRIIKPAGKNADHIAALTEEHTGRLIGMVNRDKDGAVLSDVNPPYEKGDILYVRETWNCLRLGNAGSGYKTEYWYKADDTENNPDDRWRPSIHMPKEAARIWLKVTDVRAEQLQDITAEDLYREGIVFNVPPCLENEKQWPEGFDGWDKSRQEQWFGDQARADYIASTVMAQEALRDFKKLWDSTIKEQDRNKHGWDANPWVWVIEFEKMENTDK